jgi:hypothetical protein
MKSSREMDNINFVICDVTEKWITLTSISVTSQSNNKETVLPTPVVYEYFQGPRLPAT